MIPIEKLIEWLEQWFGKIEQVGTALIYYDTDTRSGQQYSVTIEQPNPSFIVLKAMYGQSDLLDKVQCSRKRLNELQFKQIAGSVSEQKGAIYIQTSFLAHPNDDDYNELSLYNSCQAIKAMWALLNNFFDNLK